MLHVLNGDATRWSLERSTVEGVATVWADVLHDGPTPGGLSPAALRQVRAKHLAARFGVPEAEVLARLCEWDTALERFREHEEVIFWFEHDLFDQLILIRHLHWLSGIDPGSTRFSLLCIGAFPGIENFTGLGQLSPEQLATLPARRQVLTPDEIQTGRRAWELFAGPDPWALQEWLEEGVPGLPFLAGAIHRHFEDYPSERDGLGRTERQMLTALAEGNDTFAAMFRACQVMEERVFMGDSTFWAILRDLAGARHPLVQIRGGAGAAAHRFAIPPATVTMHLTDIGRDVLDGRADHVAVNGIDRWMGGVHLTTEHCWRSDGEALVMRKTQ